MRKSFFSRQMMFVLLLLLCFFHSDVTWANAYTNFDIVTDEETGIVRIEQESYTSNTSDTEERKTEVPLVRKSQVNVYLSATNEDGCNTEAYFMKSDTSEYGGIIIDLPPLIDIYYDINETLKSVKRTSGNGTSTAMWSGTIEPMEYVKYYIKTYAHKGISGYSKAFTTVEIKPYYKLEYTATGGSVQAYVNGQQIPPGDDGTIEIVAGSRVYLKAVPAEGYRFHHWEGIEEEGNELTSDPFIMKNDLAGDNAVIAQFEELDLTVDQVILPEEPITPQVGGATFTWEQVEDDRSGIRTYQVVVTSSQTAPSIDDPAAVDIATPPYQITNLSSKNAYYAWVRAIDGVDNIGEWVGTDRFYVQPEQTSLVPEAGYLISGQLASYFVKLKIDRVDTDSYTIERTLLGMNQWSLVGQVSDSNLGADPKVSNLTETNFIYTDSNLRKHQNYEYRVITSDAIQEYPITSLQQSVGIANIIPDYTISLQDGEVSNVVAQMIEVSPSVDIENDQIQYQVWYKKADQPDSDAMYRDENVVSAQGLHTVTINSLTSGIWEWWLKIKEYDGQNQINVTTTPHQKLYIDQAPPEGQIRVKESHGADTLSVANPTNTRNARIEISGINDPESEYSSGVQFIQIWNDVEGINSGRTLTYDEYLSGSNSIPWTLSAGEGRKSVQLKVTDYADNEYISQWDVLYDVTAPHAPNGFEHTPDEYTSATGSQTITFSWKVPNLDSDVAGFIGTYRLAGGAEQDIEMNATSSNGSDLTGSATIDVSSLGANQSVQITVSAYDKAGNISTPASYTAYTKAEIGSVTVVGGGYDPITDSHFVQWELTDGGNAKSHLLEYGEETETGFTVEGSLTLNTDSVTLTGLSRHATFDYRLVALNESDDRTYEPEPLAVTVPNEEPTDPALLFPTNYSDGDPEFRFGQCSDADGDLLKYYLYFAIGENSAETDFVKTGPYNWDDSITKTGLQHNQVYTWYIEVDDEHGGIKESEYGEFTVDIVPPVIEVVEAPRRPYTNQEYLLVKAYDLDSGIKAQQVAYKRIDSTTNQVLDTGNVNLVPDATGDLIGQIPLIPGEYHLQIFVYDLADNQTQLDYQNLKVDQRAPVLSNGTVSLPQDSNQRYITGSGQIPMSIEVMDRHSDHPFSAKNRVLRYWFVSAPGEESGEGSQRSISPDLPSYAYDLELTGSNGQEYYLAVKVEDRAGNLSEASYIGPIYLDRTPPQVNLDVTGFISYGGDYFVSDLNDLLVNGLATDTESSAWIEYNIVNVETGAELDQWGEWSAVKTSSLIAGERYKLVARGINEVGLVTIDQGYEFRYDHSAPQLTTFTGPASILVPGELAIFTIGALEEESSLVEYRLAIGSTAGGSELTELVPGNQNGWIRIDPATTEYRVQIPRIEDGTYYPTIKVTNAVGLTDERRGDPFIVENIQEKVVVIDQGPYAMSTTELTGSWSYSGAGVITNYQYRIVQTNLEAVTTWQSTAETLVTVTDLQLITGEKYHFQVQALDAEGNLVAQGTSPGVTVDGTAPVITTFNTPTFATSDNLEVEWNGDDPESEIAQVYISIGSDYYGTDVTDGWVLIQDQRTLGSTVESSINRISCDYHGNPLDLETGQSYYLTLRLINRAGGQRERTAPPIMIDDTPPPLPVVWDQGDYINTVQPLEAQWIHTPVDQESGNVSYQWALLQHGEGLEQAVWYEPTADLQVALNDAPAFRDFIQEHGKTYYFVVKATNGAGLTSVGRTDGIMVDGTAPYIPELRVLNAINLGDGNFEELNYINSIQDLALWIESTEPESYIEKYFYSSGLRENVADLTRTVSDTGEITLNSPSFTEGEVNVFAGECINVTEEISATGYSAGVMLDLGAPKVVDVNGTVTEGNLLFDWGVEPSSSPVAGYEVALVTNEEVETTPAQDEWIPNDLNRVYTVDGSQLPDGYYYLLVKAFNSAGTYSRKDQEVNQWGYSPQLTLDRTNPTITSLQHDAYAATAIRVDVTADDNLSGIQKYQYALGTLINPTQFSAGWVDLEAEPGVEGFNFSVDVFEIPDRTVVYLQVRAQDAVGLWSDPVRGEPILIDKTAPDQPVVMSDPYANVTNQLSNISYRSEDLESGITHYLISVVADIEGPWLTVPEAKPVDQFTDQLTGLELAEGTYYLVMKMKNAAGLWSTPGYSEAIKVDTTDPVLTFTDGSEELVFNETITDVSFTLNEEATVAFTLLSKTTGNSQQVTVHGLAGVNYFSSQESRPDTYILKARPTDLAGNVADGDVEQEIRINQPPTIDFNAEVLKTTPGQPTQYPAMVLDPDGTVVKYEWDFGDGNISTEVSPTHQYSEVKEYVLNLTVTDQDGKRASKTIPVQVTNTTQGRLYADETWSGTHQIKGEIVVPADYTLTILAGTTIMIEENAVTGYQHGLRIEGDLKILGGEGQLVSFASAAGRDGLWGGIAVAGNATLDHVKIQDALRGVTVLNSDLALVSVTDSILQGNNLGVHVLGGKVTIVNTSILDQTWYGIKEEQAGRVTMVNCTFTKNLTNYYHPNLLRITLEELNALPGNSGNQVQEEGI